MNVNLLIDAIVRQTTVLIAELATSRGLRAPLAHVADQVFRELSRELAAQGISRKVSADMFGMALRTYQRKVQRMEESRTNGGRSLWEAVYEFVQSKSVVTRREVLERFAGDDEELVRGVLTGLVETNLVFASGPNHATSFRAASDAELGDMVRDRSGATDIDLVWALVCRLGPISSGKLAELGNCKASEMEAALESLADADRITREPDGTYQTSRIVIPIGASSGWEGAVFDHFHAAVRTICTKLRRSTETSLSDRIGGSTYSFEIWEGHPLADEVFGTLQRFREASSDLRGRVRAYNEKHPKPVERFGVMVYGGQTFWEVDDAKEISHV